MLCFPDFVSVSNMRVVRAGGSPPADDPARSLFHVKPSRVSSLMSGLMHQRPSALPSGFAGQQFDCP